MVRLYGDKCLEKASRALSIQLQHDFDTFIEIRGSVIAGVRQINVDVRSGSNYTWTTFDLDLPDGRQGEVVFDLHRQDYNSQARRHGVFRPMGDYFKSYAYNVTWHAFSSISDTTGASCS